MLPQSVAERASELSGALNCTKGERFTRLVNQEYGRVVLTEILSDQTPLQGRSHLFFTKTGVERRQATSRKSSSVA